MHILHAFNASRERISTFGVRQERTKLARVAAIRARSSELIGASFAPLRQVGERGCCPTRSMQHVFLSPASQSPATLQLRKCTAYTRRTKRRARPRMNFWPSIRKEKKKRNAETRSPVDEKDKKDMDDEKERDR